MSWIEFWDTATSIYVNDKHKRAHYELIATDFGTVVPSAEARVLDVGCGEALAARRVAERCAELVLCEAAPNLRERLRQRHADDDAIDVVSPEDVRAMPDGTFDVIVVNSVVQYFQLPELTEQLHVWRRLLTPNGILLLGDLLPRNLSPVTDARALLAFAAANGFLAAAVTGLARTLLSDYSRKRARLGLLRFDEAEIIALLETHGFSARRRTGNIGHNRARMTIIAEPRRPELPLPCTSPVAVQSVVEPAAELRHH